MSYLLLVFNLTLSGLDVCLDWYLRPIVFLPVFYAVNAKRSTPSSLRLLALPSGEGVSTRSAFPSETSRFAPLIIAHKAPALRCMRDVDVKHHIVYDAVESGIVRLHYVKSEEQHADVLTKTLGPRQIR